MATADPNAIRAAAVSYAEMGYRVIPLYNQQNGCCHCSKGFACKSGGKHPIGLAWQDPNITFEPADFTKANIGIATGPASNLVVVDVDTDDGKDGVASLAALLDVDNRAYDQWPETYVTRTGGGGWQYYFHYTGDDIGNSAGKLGPGIDTRGKGGYVVAPPSVSTKGPYKVVRDAPVADLPEWLAQLLRPKVRETPEATYDPEAHGDERLGAYQQAIIDQELARLHDLEVYGWDRPWDQTTFEVACNLLELANAEWSTLNEATAESMIVDHSPAFDNDGWDLQRVLAKIDSAHNTVGDNATPLPDDRPDENETLHALAGLDYNPDAPAAESAVKPRAEDPTPEATAFIEPDLPEPTETTFFAAWLEDSLVAGSSNLFWEVVGAVLTGDGGLPVQVAIKGAPSLTEALTRALGAVPGPEEGVLSTGGLGLSTIENEQTDVVLEFDKDMPVTAAHLAGLKIAVSAAYARAIERGAYAAADEEVAARDVGDYRINSVLRGHIGQRRSSRGDADEFNMGG